MGQQAFLSSADRGFLKAIARLTYCNPFLPERIEYEKQALGRAFVDSPLVWSLEVDSEGERANLIRLTERVEPVAEQLQDRLAAGARPSPGDLVLYEDLVLYLLYQRSRQEFHRTILEAGGGGGTPRRLAYWDRFRADFLRYLEIPGVVMPSGHDPAHMFAVSFQIRRAFHHIFFDIVGGSMPAAHLRASIWQSIFTHDMRRYARVLYGRMGDMTTLVTGPSGTGKELVARAIGRSRYIPFNPDAGRFDEDFSGLFFPLNLSAMSPTLIESELFGHKRGSFTGAVSDRIGWLESSPPLGAVFLDEVGDLDSAIQVKLLRVLQTRTFQRLGETTDRRFRGKIIAATNRDLARELQEGRIRHDFYYRLCSDLVCTPSLREQLLDKPDDVHDLVLFIAKRIVGPEADAVTDEVVRWIDEHLGRDYPWTGNIRELEQCVRNIVIRKAYEPPRPPPRDADEEFLQDIRGTRLTAEQLLRRYCTMAYVQCGSYEQTARRLELDRRTVKAKIDPAFLERLT